MGVPFQPAESSLEFLRTSTAFSTLPPQLFERVAAEFEWVSFDQDEILCSQGEPSDQFYFVVHGRLAITRRNRSGVETYIGCVRPGEAVGELALIEGAPRTATLRAIRATVAVTLGRERYETLAARVPESLVVINRLLAARLRQAITAGEDRRPTAEILAVVPATTDAPLGSFCDRLCAALEREGPVLRLSGARVKQLIGEDADADVLDVEQRGRLLTWLNEQEMRQRFIVLEADVEATPWSARCVRHADEILLVARAAARPESHVVHGSLATKGRTGFERTRRLILVHDDTAARPSGTDRWLAALAVPEHHHVRLGVPEDIERLGRFLRRRPISLALAGGAALGFAHIGVLRALSEAGVPVDLVCGTSMGSIVSGLIALGKPWDDLRREVRQYFRGNSIYDPTLPVVSFFRAKRLDERLQKMVGDALIEDLWIKYFCVSSNLTKAGPEIHDRGGLKRAMRASSAVPGLFPPILNEDGELLVDGALVNNLPADLAAARSGGTVIAVNVIPTVDHVTTRGYREGASALRVLVSRMQKDTTERPPTIVDLLLRGIFLPTVSAAEQIRTSAALYIEPPLERFGFLNTKKFDEIVDVGYRAAQSKLSGWRPTL